MSRYYELIVSLKNECRKKRVKYNKIIRTLNRYEYDEIIHMIEIINDDNIIDIIEDIIEERIVIANNIENMYKSLPLINDYLAIFNEEPQPSLTKARKLFKTKIFINIYDFNYGMYNKRTEKELLIKDLQQNPERRFPLKLAKERGFQHFLWPIKIRRKKRIKMIKRIKS
jgi:hypothetical protein